MPYNHLYPSPILSNRDRPETEEGEDAKYAYPPPQRGDSSAAAVLALLAILGGLLAFGWASFFNVQTAEACNGPGWHCYHFWPYQNRLPALGSVGRPGTVDDPGPGYLMAASPPHSAVPLTTVERGTYTTLADSTYGDITWATMKLSVGYLINKGVLGNATEDVTTTVGYKYRVTKNDGSVVTFVGDPSFFGGVSLSGTVEPGDVVGGDGQAGWSTTRQPGNHRDYCAGGAVGVYDDPPAVSGPGANYFFGYYQQLETWTPTDVKSKFCMHKPTPRYNNSNKLIGYQLSGDWFGMSRAQFMVYLARALNGGNDPTDTSAHDGYFTDTIDTTATWYPHFRYLQNHANISNAVLDNDGWNAGSDNKLYPAKAASRFWAAHLMRYAFDIPRNPAYESFQYTWRIYPDGTPDVRTGTWSELTNRNTLGVMTPGGGDFAESVLRLYSQEIAAGAPWYKCLDRVWLQGNSQLGRRSVFSPGGQCRLYNTYEKHHILHLMARAMYWKDNSGPTYAPPSCTISAATFDVGDATARVSITLENTNAEEMTIDSAGYTIERAGSPDNQVGVDALAISGNPSVIPAGGQAILYSTATAMSHEGDYAVSWNIQTSIETSSWSTSAGEIQTSGGTSCESDLHILPLPPTCTISALAFGLGDPAARVSITLENPNGGAVTIDSARVHD